MGRRNVCGTLIHPYPQRSLFTHPSVYQRMGNGKPKFRVSEGALANYNKCGLCWIWNEKRPSRQQSCKLPRNGVRVLEADFGGVTGHFSRQEAVSVFPSMSLGCNPQMYDWFRRSTSTARRFSGSWSDAPQRKSLPEQPNVGHRSVLS
jgi:hypothetical protein